MKLGLGPLTTQIPSWDPRSDHAKVQEAVEMAQLAEKVGFDTVWVSEHHGEDDHYLSSLFTLCAAIAQATDHIKIGTNIAVVPFYNPLRLAEDAAMVDVLSGGRFILGLGIGYRDHEFTQYFKVPLKERVPRLIDQIEICKRGYEGERFSYDGNVFSYEDIRITPTPFEGRDMPLIIGAFSEPGARRAARISDGLTTYFHNYEGLETVLDWCEDEGADMDTFYTPTIREIAVADSKEEAWDQIGDSIRYRNSRYRDGFKESSQDVVWPTPDEVKDWVVYGTPEEVTEELQQYNDIMYGNGEICAWLNHMGADHHFTMESIERFGKQVAPHLRS